MNFIMKHNKYILALAFASMLTLGSCGDDFLGKEPQGVLTPEALANAQGVELLVTSAYAGLASPVEGYDPYQASPFNWVWGGIYGGDANKGSDPNDQSTVNEIELYNTLSTNGYIKQKWVWVYQMSKRVNLALQVLENAEDMKEEIRQMRKGELKFLRALAYFEGMRVFGVYLPYIDETNQENDPKVHNDKDIYSLVVADVDDAIANLSDDPKVVGEVGRANKSAAKALKAKILMWHGDLAEAQPILADVLTNGVTSKGMAYGLEDDLDNNFNALTENGKESVFAVQYSNAAENMGGAPFCLAYPHNTGPGGCCGFYQPSFELVNSFQVDANGLPYLNGEYRTKKSVSVRNSDSSQDAVLAVNDNNIAVDPRLDFAVGRFGIPYKDWGFPENGWVRDATNGGIFMPKKHVYSKAEDAAGMKALYGGWAPGSAMNLQYLSVRDLTLLYAECLANAGNLKGAMEQVNKIRRRAALDVNIVKLDDGTPAANYKIAEYPSSHAAFSNKDVCIKAIRMERKLELAMEGERWFDLSRWGGDVMASELKAYVDYEKQYISKFAGASYLSSKKTMLPVPDDEILTLGTDPETGTPYLVQPEAWRNSRFMAIRKAGDFLIVFILNGAYRFLLLKSLSSYILEFFFIETQLNFKIMKKLLCCFIILCLSVCSFSTIQAVEVENDNVDIMAVAAAMYIKGETSLKFSGGYAGSSYQLFNAPSGAEFRWSIVGSGNCYCYPNGDYCSINVYSPGSYRLVCDVYVNGVRVDGVTTYITVMP